LSADDRYLLALKTNFIDHVPSAEDSADVGIFDLDTPSAPFRKLGVSCSFNWQQGCMLQFLGPDYKSRVIYNDFSGNEYVSNIVDLETGETRAAGPAIYNVLPNGRQALTIDFARHHWCRRGYSYGNIQDQRKNKLIVPGDAISLVDLETGQSRQILSIEDMLRLQPVSSMSGAVHYLEHMTANPAGTHFAFLHRWRHSEGIHSRLLVATVLGQNVAIINDSGRMSHFCWRDDTRLLGYGGIANAVNRLRKSKVLIRSLFRFALPFYHKLFRDDSTIAKMLTGDSYLEFDVETGETRLIAPSLRAEDGHPAMLKDGRHFATDRYARSKLGQDPELLLFDLTSEVVVARQQLRSMPEFDETPIRCDLHPRVSPSGRIITIDTMDRGKRDIYAYRVLGVKSAV
ncbi:hypothetical protein JYU02_00270, partial [bacterium AH-315-P15]|nr:hypothetical protein [bacterium AH-315-P15]